MNFIKRAWLSTKVKKGRTILLIAVFSAILIFILAGLTIQSASIESSNNAKNEIGATATLSVNREAMFSREESDEDSGERGKIDPSSFASVPIPFETVQEIAGLSQVESMSVLSSSSAGKTDGIEPVSSTSDSEETTEESTTTEETNQMGGPGGEMPSQGEAGNQFGPGNAQGDFSISGVLTSDSADDFTSGTASLVSGEAISQDDKDTMNVLIEQTLAESNDLSVGDTFTK